MSKQLLRHFDIDREASQICREGVAEGVPSNLSVAHYGEQNGDLMCVLQMCFELNFGEEPYLDPFYYRDNYLASSSGAAISSVVIRFLALE